MNRRHFLTALTVLLTVAVFVGAKIAASWRPVAIGQLLVKQTVPYPPIAATKRYIIAGGDVATVFDLKTGEVRKARDEGVVREQTAVWELRTGHPPQLIVRADNGQQDVYVFPASCQFQTMHINPGYDMVAFSEQHIDLLFEQTLYRWDRRSHRFERQIQLTPMDAMAQTLERGGEKAVQAWGDRFEWVSTRTGRFDHALPNQSAFSKKVVDMGWMSPFGNYALYREFSTNSKEVWSGLVINASAKHSDWEFEADWNGAAPAFSLDENFLAVPLSQSNTWQIRDLKTGALVSTLPLVPGANSAAFSPDGATLYSIANGILYRQRAH